MEYFVGSISTLIIIFCVIRLLPYSHYQKEKSPFRYSQSHIHEIISPLLPDALFNKNIIRQSSKHEERTNIKVIIIDGYAYWVKDNLFYMADMDGDGVDSETTRLVDTIHMDKVQLDKMLFIMDKLRDGKNDDSSGTGN